MARNGMKRIVWHCISCVEYECRLWQMAPRGLVVPAAGLENHSFFRNKTPEQCAAGTVICHFISVNYIIRVQRHHTVR